MIIDYNEHQTGGTLALAKFSNGELVEFVQAVPPGGDFEVEDDWGGRQELHQGVGWFVSDLGPSAGKEYKAEAAGLRE